MLPFRVLFLAVIIHLGAPTDFVYSNAGLENLFINVIKLDNISDFGCCPVVGWLAMCVCVYIYIYIHTYIYIYTHMLSMREDDFSMSSLCGNHFHRGWNLSSSHF